MGGTVSRVVPLPGGRLARSGRVGVGLLIGLSDRLSKLCERAGAGGRPGGGGGSGIPGSHVTGLREWLAEREELAERPNALVEAALRAVGARTVGPLRLASGA